MAANNNTPFPPPNLSFTAPDGTPERNWYELFLKLFERTGGAQPPADVAELIQQIIDALAQAEVQAVAAQAGAIMDLQHAVDALRQEIGLVVGSNGVVNRLSEIESLLHPIQDIRAALTRAEEIEGMLVEMRPPATAVAEQWTAPSLTNSWVNFGSAFNPVGYWKDNNGTVFLRGVVKSGVMGSSIFTLPAGYRPANRPLCATISNDAFARVDIFATGEVMPQVGSNVYFSLDNISFRAA